MESSNKTKITVKDCGPIRIEGDFELYDGTGKLFAVGDKKAISICRCAHSANQPFCDGSHKACGFDSKVNADNLIK
ncbi:MAG TPA: CDGSH iron-sulfur domain-containing protein [Oligoflexia bacterium]|nr:CDGSH iron-sulfur domain-containing protein [Oligoflexia bacterium]HMP26593.1 CDGSH iron-sulfur domain-containing protein [Oligoflexia bacterium]